MAGLTNRPQILALVPAAVLTSHDVINLHRYILALRTTHLADAISIVHHLTTQRRPVRRKLATHQLLPASSTHSLVWW